MGLYSHIWKSFIRNERWRRSIFVRILYIVLILYLLLIFFMLGYEINKILATAGGDPIDKFNSFLLWYLASDLLIRCLMQPVPALQTVPYLRLCIRRKILINNILVRSMANIFNILPLLVIVPFAVKTIVPAQGALAGMFYIAGFILLLIQNNFLALLIELLARKNYIVYLIPIGIMAVFGLLLRFDIPIEKPSIDLGQGLAHASPLIYGPIAIALFGIIYLTRRVIHNNLYLDIIGSKSRNYSSGMLENNVFRKMGDTGRYISLEIYLILRNKRPRQTMLMVLFFLIYFLFMVISNHSMQGPFFTFLVVTMLTGFGAASYGQFMFSWESTYFDGIMARKNNFVNYIKAKYYLMTGMTLIIFIPILTTFMITKLVDIYLLFSILLFSLGGTPFVIMFMGTFNDGRVDLNSGTFMNYQGVKGSQFLLSFLFVMLPFGIYSLFKFMFNDYSGKIAIALPGLILIIFHNWWIEKLIIRRFYTRKYKNLEGFRKLSN